MKYFRDQEIATYRLVTAGEASFNGTMIDGFWIMTPSCVRCMKNRPKCRTISLTHKAHILRTRFGLLSDDNNTLEEVGRKLKVTRERVRQLETQARNRLRQSSHADSLRLYLDA